MIKDLIKWAKTFPPISVPYKKALSLLHCGVFLPPPPYWNGVTGHKG